MDAPRRQTQHLVTPIRTGSMRYCGPVALGLAVLFAAGFVIVDSSDSVSAQSADRLPVIQPRQAAAVHPSAVARSTHTNRSETGISPSPVRVFQTPSLKVSVPTSLQQRNANRTESRRPSGTTPPIHNVSHSRQEGWPNNRNRPAANRVVNVSNSEDGTGTPTTKTGPTQVPPAPTIKPNTTTDHSDTTPTIRPFEDTASEPTNVAATPPAVVRRSSAFVSSHAAYPGASRYRANNEADARVWMDGYRQRAVTAPPTTIASGIAGLPQLDPNFTAWWDGVVRSSAGLAPKSLPVALHGLVQQALVHSPQVLALKAEPNVQYHVVGQEEARFDWSAFLETTFNDLKDPVGNQLALGNVPGDRLKDRNIGVSAGLRRRTRTGAEVEFFQRVGRQRQNSQFFTPNPQGNSRLELQYRQPVLNGAGAVVNESQIVLARIAANASEDDVVVALQDHLVQVTEAYWTLYRARAEYLQRHKLLQSSEGVLAKLEGRNQVDTIPRQILRARAAVARAQTGIQRSLSRIQDAEAQLRLLVNSPDLLHCGSMELIPQLSPVPVSNPDVLQHSLNAALKNRADISEAIRQMRASGVRLGVSRNELLPRLDLIVSSYVSDITDSSISRSLNGQFGDARPSYSVGFEFEVPLGNRAARSRIEQRKWELKRSVNVFRATVEKALTDVEVAHREVATAWSEVLSRFQAMTAAQNEASYLQDRFDVLPAAEDSATLLLEDLLDAFERVSDEEAAFVQAQVGHAIAIIRLRREVGTLLRAREGRPELDAHQTRWLAERMQSTTPSPSASDASKAQPNGDAKPQQKSDAKTVKAESRPTVTPVSDAEGNLSRWKIRRPKWLQRSAERSE